MWHSPILIVMDCAGIKVNIALLLACSLSALAQSQAPVFRVETNLQSISVEVTDKQRNDVHGLTASDFTLLEAGQPQKIAFFEAESEPISLAILIDSSRIWISAAR
jgi:hypothetical protein